MKVGANSKCKLISVAHAVKKKRTEKLTLFSDDNGSLLKTAARSYEQKPLPKGKENCGKDNLVKPNMRTGLQMEPDSAFQQPQDSEANPSSACLSNIMKCTIDSKQNSL